MSRDVRRAAAASEEAVVAGRPSLHRIFGPSFLELAAFLRAARDRFGIPQELCHLAPPDEALPAADGSPVYWAWVILDAERIPEMLAYRRAYRPAEVRILDELDLYKAAVA